MKSYKTLVFVALLGIMAAGCQKPEEQKPTDNKGTVWTLTVNASKGDDTKALAWGKDGDKDILTPKWNDNEFVDVYFGNTKIGYLVPEASTDGSTTLSGDIEVDSLTPNSDNTLMLLFPGSGSENEKPFTYLNQNGSNPTGQIASTYDYALADITVYKGESSITPAGSASFTNQQSIYQFAFTDKTTDSPLTVSSFTITSAHSKLVQNRTNNGGTWTSSYGPITVSTGDTYSTEEKKYYVALRNEFVPGSGGTDEYFFSFINDDGALYEASKVIKNAAFDGNGVINGKLMKATIKFEAKVIAQAASGTIDEQTDVL